MAEDARIAIVYYSLSGNCRLAAEMLAQDTGARMVDLRPEKELVVKGFASRLKGGVAAMAGQTPKLLNGPIDLADVDTVVLISPVWAGTCAPAMNTFLAGADLSGKRVALVASSKSGRDESTLASMRKKAGEGCTVVAQVGLVEPIEHPGDARRSMQELAATLKA